MPEFSVDFSDAVDFSVLLPVDWYRIRVRVATLGKSGAGNAKIAIQLEVTEGEYLNRRLFDNLVLEGTGAGRTKMAFRALFGEAVEHGTTEDLVGAEAEIRVTQKVWAVADGGDGEMQNRISKYRPVSSALEGGLDFVADDDDDSVPF